jgi:hypothetical protein
VLTIGRLAADGGAYYVSTVASGVEEYHLGAGEAPGRRGRGAPRDLASEQEPGRELANALERSRPHQLALTHSGPELILGS